MQSEPGSFRDPSGQVFYQGDKVFRQVNKSYQEDYDLLLSSGLYDKLVESDLLIKHRESEHEPLDPADAHKVIEVGKIPLISYPYEWSFSQLKDAALLTLEIQVQAFAHGMVLKDASAYNVQFLKGKPIFIDTLSFEKYETGKPWVAYKQFCRHFLAPLALMAKVDVRLQQLLKQYIDGLPLDMASSLLPVSTWLKPGLLTHIHLHAKSQNKYAKVTDAKPRPVSQFAFKGLIQSLQSTINSFSWHPSGTEWGDYYTFTNYSDESFRQKRKIIESFIDDLEPKSVWDLGANNGLFSRIASSRGILTAAFDIDPVAVEKGYRQVKEEKETHILPLVMDLTNPSPAIGWAHQERRSFLSRSSADMVFALALIHHLAISNNVPLPDLAKFFAGVGKTLIIEFVPKGDSQVNKLLATRKDIFTEYNETGFEKAFSRYFDILKKQTVEGSKRTIYLMETKK